MEKRQVAQEIFKKCYLKGRFTLRSGQVSEEYFDKYAMESSPQLLDAVAEHLAPLIPPNTDGLAALEMGGIPLGTALSLKTKIPVYFVRKEAKSYGTQRICEGGDIQNKNLCIVEDVITTGGQVLKSAKSLRDHGALVRSVLCVIYRGTSLKELEQAQLKVHFLFSKKDLTLFDSK